MALGRRASGIVSGRLSQAELEDNFSDLHPPLDKHEAAVEADRCYFCHDAPCMIACPTSIDIPMFIRQISTGNPIGSAETILKQNIMGGMCARVCPTEQLCEEVCVRNTAEETPVRIGLLQRHATDALMADGRQIFKKAEATGKKIAVVGAGPAGLSCAHRLATLGHSVEVFEARPKSGGLNEFGIAAYKSIDNFAQREVEYILGVGGITVEHGKVLGKDVTISQLSKDYDAVFVGVGLGAVNSLRIDGEDLKGVVDAIDYIAELRQSETKEDLPVGRRVVVIGGGMTAIDIAVQSKRLGAEEVTIVYRRGREDMKASPYEQEIATSDGVVIRPWAQPNRVVGTDGKVTAMEFEYTENSDDGRLGGTGEMFSLTADTVFKAIGQKFVPECLSDVAGSLKLSGDGRITVSEDCKTSLDNVWAGGDCITGGQDLTVAAVEDGKVAALSIDQFLKSKA